MNKLISKILVLISLLLSFTACIAEIKIEKIDPSGSEFLKQMVKIYGNCGMCQKVVENAENLKKIKKVDWNIDIKMVTLTYNVTKTNQNQILKLLALEGYDNDKFLTLNNAFNNLPICCHYERVAKIPVNGNAVLAANTFEHSKMNRTINSITTENQLKVVFDNYFVVKDALVKTNRTTASAKAKELLVVMNTVKMESLKMEQHIVCMKVVKNLKKDAQHIADSKDVKHQRDNFDTLSSNIYELIKVSKQDTPTYFQHCPMANDGKGADWLSKENNIKNLYYGLMILSCGKAVETIK